MLVLADAGLRSGALLSLGGGVVGVSNLFAPEGEQDRAWVHALAAAARYCPGLPVVGYEHGDGLATAVQAGFTPLAPLRVWMRRS